MTCHEPIPVAPSRKLSEILALRHAEYVVAAIDMHDLAGGAGRRIRAEVERGAAHRLERGVGAQGRVGIGVLEGLARAADGAFALWSCAWRLCSAAIRHFPHQYRLWWLAS